MNSTIRWIALGASMALAACGTKEAPEVSTQPATSTPAESVSTPSQATIAEYSMAGDAVPAGHCALDAINSVPPNDAPVAAGSPIVFGGWISDANKQVPDDALLVLKGEQKSYSAEILTGVARPDVAEALDSDPLRTSGFNLSTTLQNVVPGDYQLLAVYPGASPAFCSFNTVLSVGE